MDLDDLGRLRWLTDDPPAEVQLVSDNCAQVCSSVGLSQRAPSNPPA